MRLELRVVQKLNSGESSSRLCQLTGLVDKKARCGWFESSCPLADLPISAKTIALNGLFIPLRLLDTKFFQAVLQGAESQSQELRGFRAGVVGLFHRLHDEIAFDVFKTNSFRWQLKRAFCD